MFTSKTKSIEFIPREPHLRMMNVDTQEKDYKDYTEMYDLCIECINKNGLTIAEVQYVLDKVMNYMIYEKR
jgi:hypothetical protein